IPHCCCIRIIRKLNILVGFQAVEDGIAGVRSRSYRDLLGGHATVSKCPEDQNKNYREQQTENDRYWLGEYGFKASPGDGPERSCLAIRFWHLKKLVSKSKFPIPTLILSNQLQLFKNG